MDPDGSIAVVGNEVDLPYARTPLSKELWTTADPKVRDNLAFEGYPLTEDAKEKQIMTVCTCD